MTCSTRTLHGLWSDLLLLALPFAGCSGSDGTAGVSTASITGTVTNSATGDVLANATITTTPAIAGLSITTNANGVFAASLPSGPYTITCTMPAFASNSKPLSVLAGVPARLDFAMVPSAPVLLTISGAPRSPAPGSSFELAVTATPMDGSTVLAYHWQQVEGSTAALSGGTTANASVTLADAAAYKQNLVTHLDAQDRWTILGIDPHAAELGAATVFEVTVTTSSGSYSKEVAVTADLAFSAWSAGIGNVPVGLPVLLGGKVQASYDWVLTRPGNSSAVLNDATTRFPWFVPDVSGNYSLAVTDIAASATVTVPIRGATWQGGIIGIDGNGQPVTDCATACHSTAPFFPEKFADWAATGHAEIFKDNINTGDHYSASCLPCHTVGFDTTVSNGGMDDTAGYSDFLGSMFAGGMSHMNPANWSNVVTNWPNQARMANIQCENCHGPNGSGATHANAAASSLRASTSAAVCGVCHGEPPRHARYQQWQESGHGNFETAIGEGTNGSCAKCHSAQGFLEWFANGLSPTYATHAVAANDVQPITCVVCHDPHNVGTTTGTTTNATMRVEGDSPMLLGGYVAYGLGKGAICIVCHNTRRGDAEAVVTTTPDQAPHLGAQGDVLMGKNMFFVTGTRGAHSLITDSCVTCHIELTPPPADLSYQLGGTNHSFAANPAICSNCHGLFDANSLKALTHARLEALAEEIGVAIEKEIAFHTAAGRSVRVTGLVNNVSTTTDITNTSVVHVAAVVESHGRSAMNIMVNSVLYEGVRVNSDTQIIDGGTPNGRLLANTYSSIELIIGKALWNLSLIESDKSFGIHNPGLVTELIEATSAQLTTNWP